MITVKTVGQLFDTQSRILFNCFDDDLSIKFAWIFGTPLILSFGVAIVKLSNEPKRCSYGHKFLSLCTADVIKDNASRMCIVLPKVMQLSPRNYDQMRIEFLSNVVQKLRLVFHESRDIRQIVSHSSDPLAIRCQLKNPYYHTD
ncbi:hypothetical protein KIN20_012820 [Parelaphostrongylus tenuis]|uniref:Uncharacterized protein n=1 Tax=Parelaphostrongylus tenuis TaxID=148309 RepID=A0AAD5QM59_PARTN|nr:hypothetical protein KIN20_012820 [Parelaphostrongylus tenuis]